MAQLTDKMLELKAEAAKDWLAAGDTGTPDWQGFEETWTAREPETLIRAKAELEAEATAKPEPEPDPLTLDYGSMKKPGEDAPQGEVEEIDGRRYSGGVQLFDYQQMRNPNHIRFH
ncbi:MAG: hypothetical protein GY851_10580 [bacterium]|nr:hypothetical protein [bacterium]